MGELKQGVEQGAEDEISFGSSAFVRYESDCLTVRRTSCSEIIYIWRQDKSDVDIVARKYTDKSQKYLHILNC